MSMFDNVNNIKLLQNLFNQHNDSDSESDDDRLPTAGVQKLGPGNIASSKKSKVIKKSEEVKSKVKNEEKEQPKNIEEWEQMQLKEDENILENRQRPEYRIVYKQAISTEDVFFQMNNKTAATTSCEDMIIEIDMPNETVGIEHMNLSVLKDEIDLQTPIYRLNIPLTQTVNPDKGKAKWDIDKKMLILTLRMEREFDFVNF